MIGQFFAYLVVALFSLVTLHSPIASAADKTGEDLVKKLSFLYVQSADAGSFASDPPNATLSILGDSTPVNTIIELRDPKRDGKPKEQPAAPAPPPAYSGSGYYYSAAPPAPCAPCASCAACPH